MNYRITVTTDTKHGARTILIKNISPSIEKRRLLETHYDNILQGFWVGELFFPRERVLYTTTEEVAE